MELVEEEEEEWVMYPPSSMELDEFRCFNQDFYFRGSEWFNETNTCRTAIEIQSMLTYKHDYYSDDPRRRTQCNIIHAAVEAQQLKFIQVALQRLPSKALLSLLRQPDSDDENTQIYTYHDENGFKSNGYGGWNPFHYAALRGLPFLKILVKYYRVCALENKDEDGGCLLPWLLANENGDTPLHVALSWLPVPSSQQSNAGFGWLDRGGESNTNPRWLTNKRYGKGDFLRTNLISIEEATKIALYLLSLDMNVLNKANKNDLTPLFCAVMKGFHRVAETILTSSFQYSVIGPNGYTLLHLVSNSSENVLRLLLEKHCEVLKNRENPERYSVLHKWAEIGELWPLKYLEKHDICSLMELMCSTDHKGATPLHVAVGKFNIEFADSLLDIYKRERERKKSGACPLWAVKDDKGDTSFHIGLLKCADIKDGSFKPMAELLSKIMLEDPSICSICNNDGESPLFFAVRLQLDDFVNQLLKMSECEFLCMPTRGDGQTVLHMLPFCKEETGKLLVEKFWWLVNSTDNKGRKPKESVREKWNKNHEWALKLLSKASVGKAKRDPFDWIAAAKGGHLSALFAYIDQCPNFLRNCGHKGYPSTPHKTQELQ